jgi:membrane protein
MSSSSSTSSKRPAGSSLPILGILAFLVAVAYRERDSERPPSAKHRERTDDGHGRLAAAPSEIPARGWRDILLRTYKEFNEDRILSEAAGVTFYGLLAIFPALAALVSVFGLFADPAEVEAQIRAASGILPGGAIEVIGDQVHRIASHGTSTLGLSFVIGLATALWSASAGTKAMMGALNIAYEEKERRGFIRLAATAIALTLGGIVFAIVAVFVVVAIPIILGLMGLGQTTELLIAILRWPVIAVLLALFLAVLYRFGPSRDRPKWQWVSWGSVAAAILWLVVSALFSWYVSNFGSYDKTYGSLGAVIGFLTWMWLSATVVLFGAELNAEMEHQTARDTTVGAPRPLGARKAEMADSVGDPQ